MNSRRGREQAARGGAKRGGGAHARAERAELCGRTASESSCRGVRFSSFGVASVRRYVDRRGSAGYFSRARARVVVGMRVAYLLLAFLAPSRAPRERREAPRQPFVLGATSSSELELEAPAPHGCAAHATETACHAPCVWCTSAAVPSACYGPKAAARLPPAVFECK